MDGMGGINGRDAFNLLDSGIVKKLNVKKSDAAENGGVLYEQTVSIYEPMTIRAVIVWLEDALWIRHHSNRLRNDFDIEMLLPNGKLYSGSWGSRDNIEAIEVNVTRGVYTFRILNTAWRDSHEYKDIGLAIYAFTSDEDAHPR